MRGGRPLRVLHVTPYSAEAWAYGGIPRLSDALARGLARRGHAVTICATDVCDESSRLPTSVPCPTSVPGLTSVPDATSVPGVTLRLFRNVSNRMAYRWQLFLPIGLGRYLKGAAGEFDIAHLHACRNLPGAIAAWHLRRAGVPYVLAPNGTALRIERRRLAKRIFDAVLGARMVRDASRLIAVSDAERRQFAMIGVAADRIKTVPNPVDLDEFEPPPVRGAFRRRLGSPAGPIVMFLGQLSPRKRVDVLVRAFARITDRTNAQLVIAGNDMGAGASVRRAARDAGVSDRTIFTGLLRGRERLEALADADVVVYPSQDEIFGLVPLESLLCGTPVIVADDSGCAEVVSAVGGGQVVALGDVETLARAIDNVLDHPDDWRAAATSASTRIRDTYAADVVCAQLEAVYENVIAEPNPQSLVPNPQSLIPALHGISFVVPVRNGAAMLRDAIDSIVAQADGRPLEIIIVDDGSVDGSIAVVESIAHELGSTIEVRLIRRQGGGAAAAINAGVRAARYPIICQVDQDLRLQAGWMRAVAAGFDDPAVGAVQGYYATDPRASMFSRVMGLDLEQRYAAISGETDHVCTGNTAYRAEALHRVGLFDERMGYGYDNDMSYRLRAAGYRLGFRRDARAFHRWRDGLMGYLAQQYGLGYGRIDLVDKHRRRFLGDRVSPPAMMLHPIVMLAALAIGAASVCARLAGYPAFALLATALSLVGVLSIERLVSGIRAAWRFRDRAALLFPICHLLRDLAWVGAIVTWSTRRLIGNPGRPSHSMYPRVVTSRAVVSQSVSVISRSVANQTVVSRTRVVALIPAHNEAANLESVALDIRRHRPDVSLLVIDDGSGDETVEVLERLGVPTIHFSERMGIGSAMRAGLRYAVRLGFDVAVRLDGDGQHDAADIDALVAPIDADEADVVLGTRFGANGGPSALGGVALHGPLRRILRFPLATCLTALTGRQVTDPTSGFYAFGPAAVRLLAEHHPDGYAEPELRLFLSRNGLRVVETPVRAQPRLSGRTSLTPGRLAVAAARVALAMLIVPLRASVKEPRV